MAASSTSDRSRDRLRNARWVASCSMGCEGGLASSAIRDLVLFLIGRNFGGMMLGFGWVVSCQDGVVVMCCFGWWSKYAIKCCLFGLLGASRLLWLLFGISKKYSEWSERGRGGRGTESLDRGV